MFMSIVNAIIAIPKLIDQVSALVGILKHLQDENWFQNSNEVFARLKDAKTSEDRKKSAKELGDLIAGL